jgi:hypothetical protein
MDIVQDDIERLRQKAEDNPWQNAQCQQRNKGQDANDGTYRQTWL